MPNSSRIDVRVLFLDDAATDADLVRVEIEQSGLTVNAKHVNSDEAFLSALETFAPDIVLAEHTLVGTSAVNAMKVLTAVRPVAPMIVVTNSADVPMAVSLLRAGINDIILKSEMSRLGPAIEAALTLRKPLRSLSPRQLEVLRLVAEGETSPEIATRLNISVKTVETHRTELMRRIGVHDVVALVRYAIRVGLVFPA